MILWRDPTSLMALLLLPVLAAYFLWARRRRERALAAFVVVAHDEATVRFEPSASGTAHFQAKPGTVVRLLGAREGWARVERADGRRGWVEQAAVAVI